MNARFKWREKFWPPSTFVNSDGVTYTSPETALSTASRIPFDQPDGSPFGQDYPPCEGKSGVSILLDSYFRDDAALASGFKPFMVGVG